MKEYTENGIKYIFDYEQMNAYFIMKQHARIEAEKKKISKELLINEIAATLYESSDAVKKWLKGKNSPGDIGLVKKIAKYLELDYHELLQKKKQEEEDMAKEEDMAEEKRFMEFAHEKQVVMTKMRVREIYEALVDAVNTSWDYFYAEYYSADDSGSWQAERHGNTTYEQAEDYCREVNRPLIKYMLYIPKELYKKIRNLLWTQAEGVVMDTSCAFSMPYDEEEEIAQKEAICDLLERGYEFQEKKYAERMREVFGNYIVD